MAKDYIPTSDLKLADWLDNLHTQLTSKKAALNVPDSALAKLATAKDDFRSKMKDADAKRLAYETALEAETESRRAAIAEARALAQQAQREPGITNQDRTELGLTVPDTKPTAPPVPDSFPVVTVDTSKRLRHGLSWNDHNTPTSRARPAGVAHTEIWRYIGATPPTDISQFNLIKIVTKTNHTVEYQSPDAGKTAYFNLRWVNSQDQSGPWSETISATITG